MRDNHFLVPIKRVLLAPTVYADRERMGKGKEYRVFMGDTRRQRCGDRQTDRGGGHRGRYINETNSLPERETNETRALGDGDTNE